LPKELLRKALQSPVSGNLAALYGAHLLGLIVPLVTIPYLARVLRPEGWGLVIFAQSLAASLIVVVEYAFDLFGTRAIARSRAEPERIEELVAAIQGSKILLVVIVTLLSAALLPLIPLFRDHPLLLFWAWAFAVLKGLSPFWYFLGVERVKGAAMTEAGAKAVAALGVFVWVKAPEDGWIVLALQAGTAGLALLVLTVWLYGEVRPARPRVEQALSTMKASLGLFIFRASSGVYIQANAFILGLLTTPQVVSHFGGAEKIVRAAVNLLHPISQALFARLSHLVVTDPNEAKQVFRLCLVGMIGLGSIMGGVAFVGAAPLVRVLLGPGYEAAVPVLRVLALLPPIIAVGGVFGIHWALPMGLDRPFYLLVLMAGVLNIGLALLLAPRLGAIGMASSVVLADTLVALGLLALYRSRGFSRTTIS